MGTLEGSLKKQDNSGEYGNFSRVESMSAVEWACERIFERIDSMIDSYLQIHEIYPEFIGIESKKYSPDYCASILRQRLSKEDYPLLVFPNGRTGGLIIDLDAEADLYFDSKLKPDSAGIY